MSLEDLKTEPTPILRKEGIEKRRHARVEVNLLVQFRLESFKEFENQYARNLSEGGMFIEMTPQHEEGELIYFQFSVENAGRLIEGLGRVVRVQQQIGNAPSGIGLEFVNLSEGSLQLIQTVVKRRIEDAAFK